MLKKEVSGMPDGEYHDTKIVRFHNEDGGMAYTYMLTRISNNREDHNLLSREGYRGNYLIMTLLIGGDLRSGSDPYTPPMRSDLSKEFLIEIRDGDIGWDQIEDDETYTRKDLEEMK